MGSTESDDEKPRHLVTISRPFYLGVYPVTQREYMQIARKNPSHFSGSDRLPVENVSWFDAVAFLQRLEPEGGPRAVLRDQWPVGPRCPTGTDLATGCRRRPSGNTPAGREPRPGFRSATTRTHWANMHGITRTPAARRTLSVRRSQTPSACMTCTATSGSGAGTGMMRVTTLSRPRKIPGGLMGPRTGWSGAGAGTSPAHSRGRRSATGTGRWSGSIDLGFRVARVQGGR